MRVAAIVFALITLAACGSYAGSSAMLGWNPGRQEQIRKDTTAILQGMARAHSEAAEAAACNSATPMPMRSDRTPPPCR